MRSVLKILKVAHANLLGMVEIPCIGINSGLFEITWFSSIWKHEQYFRSVQVKASNRLGSDNQESNNHHNHACDRTINRGIKVIQEL